MAAGSDVPSGDESNRGVRKKQPRWRKKYLTAGLFSDLYKEDVYVFCFFLILKEYFKYIRDFLNPYSYYLILIFSPRKPSTESNKARLVYRPEEHEHGLLPPPYHCGKYLRQRRVEFRLPYDLWWLHTHSQLPGRDKVPSWNYKKIRTSKYFFIVFNYFIIIFYFKINVSLDFYYDVKPTYTYEAQACNCTPKEEADGDGNKVKAGCADDCINRVVFSECSPQLCPCRDRCSNQRIQRHEWSPGLDKFMTKDKVSTIQTKILTSTISLLQGAIYLFIFIYFVVFDFHVLVPTGLESKDIYFLLIFKYI